jgi:hypothetical protein
VYSIPLFLNLYPWNQEDIEWGRKELRPKESNDDVLAGVKVRETVDSSSLLLSISIKSSVSGKKKVEPVELAIFK